MSDNYIVKQTIIEKTTTAGAIMSDSDSPHFRRELPRSTTELMGQAAGDVAHGVTRGGPVMMGVLLLNVIGIACAVYFLSILINGQANHLGNLLTLQTAQIKQVVDVHNREFDALMEMQAKANAALAKVHEMYTPPVTPPQVAPQPPPLTLPSARQR